MISLQGKKAIVTGGAGGIGLAGVKCFREAGADVIIADINEEAGRRAAAETGATFVKCDVSNSADVQHAVAAANGKLDILYNNA
ncbi:MAG: SDR family NAD(P)-dependent oxidoreductase, partial [Victivallales bacterium]|nr:SDR family NAD(P)-dependent oxidoreductase [Victivallales bacterium]